MKKRAFMAIAIAMAVVLLLMALTACGERGPAGEPGADGHTPVITIQNGNWYIDGVDTGKSAAGEAGASVASAYVNSDVHLILVLSDGTEIDAGYVGVEVVPTYTVTFVDHNNSVLETVSDVMIGSGVTAPEDPIRKGFRFTGWDASFDQVMSDLTVKAQYELAHNQLCFTYTDNGDGTISVTLSVEGDVNLYGLECKLSVDAVGATLAEVSSELSGLAFNQNDDYIILSFATTNGSDMTSAADLLTMTFQGTAEDVYLNFTVYDVDIFDDTMSDETYSVLGNTFEN